MFTPIKATSGIWLSLSGSRCLKPKQWKGTWSSKLLSARKRVSQPPHVGGSSRSETRDNHRGRKSWETSSEQSVRNLTTEDIESKKHTIFDIVMPLPGWNVDYPGGRVGELYEKIMRADGLDIHRMRREQR